MARVKDVSSTLEVEILNWEKYNPRKELKSTSWLRLSNTALEDPDFFDFTPAEILTWIYILSLASRKMKGQVKIHLGHLERVRGIKAEEAESAIRKLELLQCILVHERTRHAYDRERHSTNERTNEQDTTNETNVHVTPGVHAPHVGASRVSRTSETWESYAEAYEAKYRAKPVRNAAVNGKLSQFVQRLGAEEAPHVARFYLTHNDAFYVKQMHPVGLLLKDAEKLRTEWATGRRMTGGVARGAELQDSNTQTVRDYLADSEAS